MKKDFCKSLLVPALLCTAVLFSNTSKASSANGHNYLQSSSITSRVNALSVTDADWKLDTTINGVSFYYSIATCGNEQVILLAIENNNKSVVAFNWKDEVLIDGKRSSALAFKTFTMQPSERKEGQCDAALLPILIVRKQDISETGDNLTAYHYLDLKVN